MELPFPWHARFVTNDQPRDWLSISFSLVMGAQRGFRPRFGMDVKSWHFRERSFLLNAKCNFTTMQDDASREMQKVRGRFKWQKLIEQSKSRRRVVFALSNERFLSPGRARFGFVWKHVASGTRMRLR
jgi:hypothetical protein